MKKQTKKLQKRWRWTTERRNELSRLVADGCGNSQIAKELNISYAYVPAAIRRYLPPEELRRYKKDRLLKRKSKSSKQVEKSLDFFLAALFEAKRNAKP